MELNVLGLRPSTLNCKLEKVKSQKMCTFNIVYCTISYFKPSTVSFVNYIPYTVQILTGHGLSLMFFSVAISASKRAI